MYNPNIGIGGRDGQRPSLQVHQHQYHRPQFQQQQHQYLQQQFQHQYHRPQFQQHQYLQQQQHQYLQQQQQQHQYLQQQQHQYLQPQQQQQNTLSSPSPPPQNHFFINSMDDPNNFLNPSVRRLNRPNIPRPSDVTPDVDYLTAIMQRCPYDLSDADKEFAIELMRRHLLAETENHRGPGGNNMSTRLPQQNQQQPVTMHPVQYQTQPRRYIDNYIPTALQQSGMTPLQLAHMFARQRQQALQQLLQPISPRHFLYQSPLPSPRPEGPEQGNHLGMLNNPAADDVAPMNQNIFTGPPSSSQTPISAASIMTWINQDVDILNFNPNPNAREFLPTGPYQGASTSKEG